VIRVSGTAAFALSDRILKQRRSLNKYQGHTIHRAVVIDGDQEVDDVLVSVFHAPNSFTGEDTVEISCHGGRIPVSKTLELLIRVGCRAADPGEFTRRAYFNQKLDLAQAEAVCDLINAQTDQAYRQALAMRNGHLSRVVEESRAILLGVLARIEASIDFPEDVGELDFTICLTDIDAVRKLLNPLIESAHRGILIREGAQVVLAGQPNAGKSSLMNALLRTDRAIVTDVPGTTRDTLEERINIGGIAVRLWDTAGLRNTTDLVESLGVGRSRSAIEFADLVVLVVDSTFGIRPEDSELISQIDSRRLLVVWNKCDLAPHGDLRVSAKDGTGIDALEQAIAHRLFSGGNVSAADTATISHVHQRDAVQRALDSLTNADSTITQGLPADFLSIDIRSALSALGELTGQTATDDIINEIFSKFCIGK